MQAYLSTCGASWTKKALSEPVIFSSDSLEGEMNVHSLLLPSTLTHCGEGEKRGKCFQAQVLYTADPTMDFTFTVVSAQSYSLVWGQEVEIWPITLASSLVSSVCSDL